MPTISKATTAVITTTTIKRPYQRLDSKDGSFSFPRLLPIIILRLFLVPRRVLLRLLYYLLISRFVIFLVVRKSYASKWTEASDLFKALTN